ncbi:heterokaryon incompatibility protein-domain-containing protein [Tricladium varicosporioides]|nr:heterokaryon incompatibility protein-domain-containing protein [Hymenoscyphus varicosporioides]
MALCSNCELFSFDRRAWNKVGEWWFLNFASSYDALKASSRTCHLCSFFREGLDNVPARLKPNTPSDHGEYNTPPEPEYYGTGFKKEREVDAWALKKRLNAQKGTFQPVKFKVWKDDVLTNSLKPLNPVKFIVGEDSYNPAYTVSAPEESALVASNEVFRRLIRPADDLKLASAWLSSCNNHHSSCKKAYDRLWKNPARALPRRLLDTSNSRGQDICLTEEFPRKTQYATLSHCWGLVPIIRTLRSSLNEHKENISFNNLSKTFKDAVIICRRLGIQYLWIDSLCIVQDDAQDWEIEAAKMADIYACSFLNISALASPDGAGGCFYPRNRTVSIPSESNRTTSEPIYISRSPSDYWVDIAKCPLASRAWVIQERVLPPRSLIFGSDQIHWECLGAIKSESSFKNLPLDWSTLGLLRRYLVQDKDTEIRQGGDAYGTSDVYFKDPFRRWYEMVKQYTACGLTKGEDKLPALSGLATAFSRRTGYTYYAGLWEQDLIRGFLWEVSSFDTSSRPSYYRAPSWSWASIDGKISTFRSSQRVDTYTPLIRNFRSKILVSEKAAFGAVSEGSRLYVTGRLKKFKMVLRKDKYEGSKLILIDPTGERTFRGDEKAVGSVQLDVACGPKDTIQQEVYCLPFASKRLSHSNNLVPPRFIISLVLKRIVDVERNEDVYGRMGLGYITGKFMFKDVVARKGKYDDIFKEVDEVEVALV